MTTTARERAGQPPAPRPTHASGAGAAAEDAHDAALGLIQRHQIGLITPALVRDAERRLDQALRSAATGRRSDPGLLLEQLFTDLGVTLSLP